MASHYKLNKIQTFNLAYRTLVSVNHPNTPHGLTSGLLHLQFPLPGMLSPQILSSLAPMCQSDLSSKLPSSERPAQCPSPRLLHLSHSHIILLYFLHSVSLFLR